MADCSLQIVTDDIGNASANVEMLALHMQFSFCGDQQLDVYKATSADLWIWL